jgi:hypothetical protein
MMDLMLETRAWALARPRLETERHGLLLLEEIKGIQAAEAEQGAYTLFGRLDKRHLSSIMILSCYGRTPTDELTDRVRQGLVQFVQNIKSALAALASLV